MKNMADPTPKVLVAFSNFRTNPRHLAGAAVAALGVLGLLLYVAQFSSSSEERSGGSLSPVGSSPARATTHTIHPISSAALPPGQLRCNLSGICSLGQVKPFDGGDIAETAPLKAALQARAYKNELILFTAPHILQTILTVNNLAALGFEHYVFIAPSEAVCMTYRQLRPSLACSWSSFFIPSPTEAQQPTSVHGRLTHARLHASARIVRLGVNLLSMDSDALFFDDPYAALLAPALAPATLMVEGGAGGSSKGGEPGQEAEEAATMAGGLFYVKGARPDGPVAWLLAEAVDRALRWAEDGYAHASQLLGRQGGCITKEQVLFTDALHSAVFGRPVFTSVLDQCTNPDVKMAKQAMFEGLDRPSPPWQADEATVPFWMQRMEGLGPEGNLTVRTSMLRVPHTQGRYPNALGGQVLPKERGARSKDFVKQLKEECGCPLWPDPEDSDQAGASQSAPQERALLLPPWVASTWEARGRLGYWHAALTQGQARQVIGHLHQGPAGLGPSIGSLAIRMAVGAFNQSTALEVEEAMARLALAPTPAPQGGTPGPGQSQAGPGPALAPGPGSAEGSGESTTAGAASGPAPGPTAATPPGLPAELAGEVPRHLGSERYLALQPELVAVVLSQMWEEYQAVVLALAQMAAALNRTAVWPDIPCHASWISRLLEDSEQVPLNIAQEVVLRMTEEGDPSCSLSVLVQDGCVRPGQGVLEAQLDLWQRLVGARQGQGAMLPEPSEKNTILVPDPVAMAPILSKDSGRVHFMLQLDEAEVAARLAGDQALEAQPILYLASLAQVKFGQGSEGGARFNSTFSHCVGLQHHGSLMRLRFGGFKGLAVEPCTIVAQGTFGADGRMVMPAAHATRHKSLGCRYQGWAEEVEGVAPAALLAHQQP